MNQPTPGAQAMQQEIDEAIQRLDAAKAGALSVKKLIQRYQDLRQQQVEIFGEMRAIRQILVGAATLTDAQLKKAEP